MGNESDAHLQRLADVAVGVAAGTDTRRGLLAQWRRRMEQTLMFAKADAVLCALGKSDRGTRTTAKWCAARQLDSAAQCTPCAASIFPACTDAPEDPFAAMQEADLQQLGGFELEASLGEVICSGTSDEGADELAGELS